MKIKYMVILVCLLGIIVCIVKYYYKVEDFDISNCCKINYLSMSAPIVINGDIDDWKDLVPYAHKISFPVVSQWLTSPELGAADLSGEFRFVVDPYYMYIVVAVQDDNVITDMEKPLRGFENDSIVFKFWDASSSYGRKENFIKEIRVAMNMESNVQLFGNIGTLEMDVPYFWNAYGVKACFKKKCGGYNVEVAIPYTMIPWIKIEKNKAFYLNVYINDKDDMNENGLADHRLSWVNSFERFDANLVQDYRVVYLGKEIRKSFGKPKDDYLITNRLIVLGLNNAVDKEQRRLMTNLFKSINECNWKKVIDLLEPHNDKAWTKPLRAIAYLHNHEFNKGLMQIKEIIDNSGDAYEVQWAKECPLLISEEWLKNNINYNYTAYLMIMYCKFKDNRLQAPITEDIGFCLEKMGYLNLNKMVEGIDILLELENCISLNMFPKEKKESLMISLGKCYFYYKDYNNAERIASIISKSRNKSSRLGAKTIIESIQLTVKEKI